MNGISFRSPLGWARQKRFPLVWVLRALLVITFGLIAASLPAPTPTTKPPPSPSGAISLALTNVGQEVYGGAQVQLLQTESENSDEVDASAAMLDEQMMPDPSSSGLLDAGAAHDATALRADSGYGVEATELQAMPARIGSAPSRNRPPGLWRLAQFSH